MKTLKTIFFSLMLTTALQLVAQNEVMPYQDLQTYLPTSVPDYEAGEPGGSSMNMQNMSFSSADIIFTNSNGEELRITLLDYSASMMMYQAATAVWSTEMSFEDDESIAKSVKWSEKIAGWEEYRKKDKEAKLFLGISERFFLSIEATGQSNMDFVKNVAKSMPLDKLASK
ncbi:MAG: hypothetical protein K9G76_03030 [Bacteroidales bacterium]|nr:hypothetical protein [Bacteroidales bacterium]MCF8402768.1 hypothetical protein [Bacteroidales bacterium]